MRHLASPTGAGPLAAADAVGESGSAACGDLVWVALRPAGGQMQGPPDDATRAKMGAIRTQANAEYRAILNADQQKIFDQNVAEMKSRKQKGPPGSRA